MESSSATMRREEDANCDPSPAAPPSVPALLPLPSASSKRRWSPCTWRYAIEEVQAELPSRARSAIAGSAGAGAPAPPSSSRPPSQHQHHQHLQPPKAKPSPHHNPPFGKSTESVHRTPSRVLPSTESRVHVRSLAHSHPHASSKTRSPELFKKSLQHDLLSASAIISEEEDDDAEEDDDDDNDDVDDTGLRAATCFDEEYFKRRRREMSPSELYFCAECSHGKGVAKFLHD